MSYDVKVDRKTEQLDFYKDGVIVFQMDKDEARELLENLQYEVENNRPFFREFKKIKLGEVQEIVESDGYLLEEVKSMRFDVNKMTRLAPNTEAWIELKLENDNDIELWGLSFGKAKNNFPMSQVWNGVASNHEIRECFEIELLEELFKNPGFKIVFNGVEITKEDIFTEKNRYYKFGECSDT